MHITISAVNQDVKLQKLDGEVTEGHKSGVLLLTQYVKNSFSSRQTSIKTVEHCVTLRHTHYPLKNGWILIRQKMDGHFGISTITVSNRC